MAMGLSILRVFSKSFRSKSFIIEPSIDCSPINEKNHIRRLEKNIK